jgi:hypothetical protein
LIGVAMFALCFCVSAADFFQTGTCFIDDNSVPFVRTDVIDKSGGAAWAYWEETLNSTGFNHITIETNSLFDSHSQMLCAGFIDGYLMQARIYERWLLFKDINNISRSVEISPTWTDWLFQNYDYMNSQIASNPQNSFWRDISLIVDQFNGLVIGYQNATSAAQNMSLSDFLTLQAMGDIFDLEILWDRETTRSELTGVECSALVRLAPDLSDVYFGHDTWSDFRKMTNVIKEYHFNVPERVAKRVIVSTKMGALPSSEDFWMTDRGLLIFETTNVNFNYSLYDLVTPKSLLTWVRTLHAAWTSDSSPDWASEFLVENSGTYNNQYVVVDAKKFTPGQQPGKDFIWSSFVF